MTVVSEDRAIKAHDKLLLDVIRKQAGTLEKALLEGTMNAVEAGSSSVNIKFYEVEDGHRVKKAIIEIRDRGKGISSEDEINDYFETFGTPHEESEGKIWAKFRMGRGQMFAFGKNTWRTSTFKMEVDVNNKGLNYTLKKNLEEYYGCHIKIELYNNPIGSWSCRTVDSLKDKIKAQIEFMDIPVYFNEELITTSPSMLNWTQEDENAYYLFGKGMDLKVYNLGAFVMDIPVSTAGTTGIIVSKKQLDVNFARNDILHTCPIYKGIQEVIVQNRKEVTKNKKRYKRLEDHERLALLRDIRDGIQYYADVKSKNIIRTSQGKYFSLKKILADGREWVFAPEGSNIADTAMEAGAALCISDSVIDDFNYTGEKKKFFSWLLRTEENDGKNYNEDSHWWKNARKVDWDEFEERYLAFNDDENGKRSLCNGVSFEYVILKDNKLSKLEKRILKVLNTYACWKNRKIFIGQSDIANAWTDGENYIAINRRYLKDVKNKSVKLFHTLCHEMAHDENSQDTHYHGGSFYENFYDITKDIDSPLYYMDKFQENMKVAFWKEKDEEAKAKAEKAEEEKRKALGL